MKKLGKKSDVTEMTIEAYSCSCSSCNCSICTCGDWFEKVTSKSSRSSSSKSSNEQYRSSAVGK